MTELSITSKMANAIAPGGAISKVIKGFESLVIDNTSDCPMGESEFRHDSKHSQVVRLGRDAVSINSVGWLSLLIGRTVAHWGVGRTSPILFLDSRRSSNGENESEGSSKLGSVSMN